jgi:hypothetical protein
MHIEVSMLYASMHQMYRGVRYAWMQRASMLTPPIYLYTSNPHLCIHVYTSNPHRCIHVFFRKPFELRATDRYTPVYSITAIV